MLATAPPQGISALNVLAGRIDRIEAAADDSVLVRVAFGDDAAILSRITARSCRALDLAPGQPVHAILKSVAIADASRG